MRWPPCTTTSLLALGTLLVPVVASAQQPTPPAPETRPREEAHHAIGLRAGVRVTTVREDLLVPLTFSGAGPEVGATYRGLIGPGTLDAALDTGISLVSNRFGHLGITFDHALTLGYLVPVGGAERWRFAAGGMVGENTDTLAIESWDDAHRYWLGLGWIGPAARVVGPLSARWKLEATASFALFGTAGRPDAFRRNKQDPTDRVSFHVFHPLAEPRLFGPWHVQHFTFDLAVRPSRRAGRVGRGWSFGMRGRATRADFPETIIVLEAVPYVAGAWGF